MPEATQTGLFGTAEEVRQRIAKRRASRVPTNAADILSSGGGTQSVAIAVLILQCRLPRPERVVIADTDREASEVWEYMDAYWAPALRAFGVPVDRVPHSLATVDLYGLKSDGLLIPAYSTQGGGLLHAVGKLPTFCSSEWKKAPVRRHLRALGYGPYKGQRPVRMWFGMSIEEIGRLKNSDVGWVHNHYPLCFDLPMRRHESIRLVRDFGWPEPPRSACWMCPNRRNEEWAHLRDNRPDDWLLAVAFDDWLRSPENPMCDTHAYVHHSGVPLAEAEIDVDDSQTLFERGCESGQCFV